MKLAGASREPEGADFDGERTARSGFHGCPITGENAAR